MTKLLVAVLLLLSTAVGLASPALAADAPGRLTDTVESLAREQADGHVAWARYVATSADTAAALLGKSRSQIYDGMPERVYLVVMRGDFSMDVTGTRGRAPYLAFLCWNAGGLWNSSDYTLLRDAPAMGSAGTPQTIDTFWLRHPMLAGAWEDISAVVVLFLPTVLLAACAVLFASRRRVRRPYLPAACLAVAVAAWQTYVALHSMAGRPWDPVFDGVKLGVLALAVCVDVAAVVVVMKARPRPEMAGKTTTVHPAWLRASVVLFGAAAVLSVAVLPWLASTGE